ncbi:hypothetical protein BHE90_009822 [Fusarium euwallaceae]|uniref:SNF2 N-terminal domain-containing protein n=1 Tax=Fusarium euwallaceae TaxID=1147111 RepID=A0A430LIY1_9HYPO|nr:hypothetical protein BHE90_009822 [Fusarium euwallaceae]
MPPPGEPGSEKVCFGVVPSIAARCNSTMSLNTPSSPFPVRIMSCERHQKQALTFMLRREQGWAFYDERPDVWEMIDTDQGRIFLNRISNAHQSEEPPQCYGGIIADPAGLGKTLTMIALAATDMERSDTDMDTSEDGQLNVPATLIVVPPPCKLNPLSAEWSSGNGSGSSTLFSVRWRRIILDEAHLIRNVSSNISQAVCALESKSRWAVTSTPILARLGDLATLFKFIRAHPYTNHRCFDADISRLWKSSHYEEAIKRLKRLSACMLLRRPKGSIDLPARRDMQCLVNFSIEEEAVYDNLRQKIDLSIERALHGDSGSSQAGIYVNILQQIESLRLVCNLGLHNSMRYGQVPLASLEDGNWANIAQETFNLQRALGPLSCSQCRSTLEIAETPLEHPSVPQQNAQFSSCLKFVCTDCTQRFFQVGYAVECGHSCPTAAISTESSVLESTLDEVQQQTRPTYRGLSSKVGALITDINALPRQEKCIVFSAWRVTLDMVEAGLEQASISNVRFDGKVPQSDRQNIVETFMTDPSIRVMLLTLYCDTAGQVFTTFSQVDA